SFRKVNISSTPPAGPGRYHDAMAIQFEPTQKTTITRTYDRPVSHEERLGGVPDDYYEPRGFFPQHGVGWVEHFDENEAGPRDVKRPVPEYNPDGSPKMETVTVTLEEETYDQKKRTVGFGLLGALVAGAAASLVLGPGGILVAALVGGAAGGSVGYQTARGDTVEEVWNEKDIVHPRMEGYTKVTVPVPEFREKVVVHDDGSVERKTKVRIQGYVHHHSPTIEEEKKGSYTEPDLEHTNEVSAGKGAAIVIGAGLAIGLLAALLGRKKG
ncbi:MAG: hypothetical protein AB1758_32135, partial [Candidatus Eremiobacterota bacterium]